MRKDFGVKTYLYPQPVLMIATFDENKNPDCMNAAWGAISDFNKVSIALSAEHKTVKNILKTKAFTISPATKKFVKECDYLGIASGNTVLNKLDDLWKCKIKWLNVFLCNLCRYIRYLDSYILLPWSIYDE